MLCYQTVVIGQGCLDSMECGMVEWPADDPVPFILTAHAQLVPQSILLVSNQ